MHQHNYGHNNYSDRHYPNRYRESRILQPEKATCATTTSPTTYHSTSNSNRNALRSYDNECSGSSSRSNNENNALGHASIAVVVTTTTTIQNDGEHRRPSKDDAEESMMMDPWEMSSSSSSFWSLQNKNRQDHSIITRISVAPFAPGEETFHCRKYGKHDDDDAARNNVVKIGQQFKNMSEDSDHDSSMADDGYNNITIMERRPNTTSFGAVGATTAAMIPQQQQQQQQQQPPTQTAALSQQVLTSTDDEASPIYSTDKNTSSKDTPLYLDIGGGVKARLRRTKETMQAVATGNFVPVTCMGCTTDLFCITDAEFLVCPVCKIVSPMTMAVMPQHQHGNEDTVLFREGVGLGITYNVLHEMQSHQSTNFF